MTDQAYSRGLRIYIYVSASAHYATSASSEVSGRHRSSSVARSGHVMRRQAAPFGEIMYSFVCGIQPICLSDEVVIRSVAHKYLPLLLVFYMAKKRAF